MKAVVAVPLSAHKYIAVLSESRRTYEGEEEKREP